MTRAIVHTTRKAMEDFNDFESCVDDLDRLVSKAWDTYEDTCSDTWKDATVEDDEGHTWVDKFPVSNDDGWPRMKEFAQKLERDKEGKFVESPDSLHPKVIGLRLPKSIWGDFEKLAEKKGLSLAELAREYVVKGVECDRVEL